MNKEYLPITADEALDHLQEECAELILAVSKVRRFGVSGKDPRDPNSRTNFEQLVYEYQDIKSAYLRYLNLTFV